MGDVQIRTTKNAERMAVEARVKLETPAEA